MINRLHLSLLGNCVDLDSYYVYTYIQEKAADTNGLIFGPMVLLHSNTDCPRGLANPVLLGFWGVEKACHRARYCCFDLRYSDLDWTREAENAVAQGG